MDRGKKSIKENVEKALRRITYAELFLYERMQEKLPAAKVSSKASVISRQWQIRGGKFSVYEKFFEIIKNILYYLYYCV